MKNFISKHIYKIIGIPAVVFSICYFVLFVVSTEKDKSTPSPVEFIAHK